MARRMVTRERGWHDLGWYLERLAGVEKAGNGFKAWCPVHADEGTSQKGLSITPEDSEGPLRMYCHSCSAQLPDVHNALERAKGGSVETPTTNARRESDGAPRRKIEKTYDYTDEEGDVLFQVVRFERKRFSQRRKVSGRWINNLGDVRRVLYRLPEVRAAVELGETVYIVEGEKDADAIFEVGGVATCNPMGAGKWQDEYALHLEGAEVVVIADRDETGGKHARNVKRSLVGVASSVRVVEALTGKDASDHLQAGHALDDLREVRVEVLRSGAVDGASFILDGPAEVQLIWGRGQEALWTPGESLLIVGPQGVGKSTLLQQLILARIGIRGALLHLPVVEDERRVFYIAADRPSQIQRSFRRMVGEGDRDVLGERLQVWRGPLPFNLTGNPEKFAPFLEQYEVGTVFIDSLKDVALDLSSDEAGSRVNAAFQAVLACGIEVVATHHQRKAQANNKKPTTLADVYGSVFITAGSGSVLLLWGAPGDAVVELSHLKQPAVEFGPTFLVHDHERGTTDVQGEVDVHVVLRSRKGVTVKQAASTLYSTDDPNRNEIEKARRKLDSLVRDGRAERQERERVDGGRPETIYHVKGDLE